MKVHVNIHYKLTRLLRKFLRLDESMTGAYMAIHNHDNMCKLVEFNSLDIYTNVRCVCTMEK